MTDRTGKATAVGYEHLMLRFDGPQTRDDVKNFFEIFRVLTGRDCVCITIPPSTFEAWQRWKADDLARGAVTVSDIVDFEGFRVLGADFRIGPSFRMH